MTGSEEIQEQPVPDLETAFGSRASPARPVSGTKKVVGPRANGTPTRRLSLNQNGSRSGKRDSMKSVSPMNHAKEDAASRVSGTDPAPTTP